jgi:ribosomal protein S18 acetylase RimI-like enzyme
MRSKEFRGDAWCEPPAECLNLRCELTGLLAAFFQRLVDAGIEKHFHPHPLTPDEAGRRAQYTGKDLYYALLVGGDIVAYGMLRGWDEGFEIPSLGVAVCPDSQGRGYGRLLMEFLHAVARQRGAKRVRLKVHSDNSPAISLYRSLGYVFVSEEAEQRVGYLDL